MITCIFSRNLEIPFGHDLAHMTLDTEDSPCLDAHPTCCFSIPANGHIESRHKSVFGAGSPGRCLPVELGTGMVIA